MTSTHITVIYKWTAKPGKLDRLKSIYEQVTEAMEQKEPDAQAVHCYISEEDNALYVRDEFKNAAARTSSLLGCKRCRVSPLRGASPAAC